MLNVTTKQTSLDGGIDKQDSGIHQSDIFTQSLTYSGHIDQPINQLVCKALIILFKINGTYLIN